MKNEVQSTAIKNEVRYYKISNNIDIDTGEVIKNTKNYIKINKFSLTFLFLFQRHSNHSCTPLFLQPHE